MILRKLYNYKGVEVIKWHLLINHVHMLVSIPPKISVSSFMGHLKGRSALMILDKHANLKYNYGNRHFWAEGYYASSVGLNEATCVPDKGIGVWVKWKPAFLDAGWFKRLIASEQTTCLTGDFDQNSSGWTAGKKIFIEVPVFAPADSAQISPPCALTSALQIANPKPILPEFAPRDLSAR